MHPTDGPITQEYGRKVQASGDPFPHTGDDYGVFAGSDVRTIAPGTVIFAGWNLPNALADRFQMVRGSDASGLHMFIQHDGWVELMAHLSEILVFAGAEVERGQVVAKSGATGRVLGAHLHYEVIQEPCGNSWPFGRYNPQDQIKYEDKADEDMALSEEDKQLMQKMHMVTREWLDEQIDKKVKAAILELTKNTQKQHDVTRTFINDTLTNRTQAQEDVTRQYLSDKINEGK